MPAYVGIYVACVSVHIGCHLTEVGCLSPYWSWLYVNLLKLGVCHLTKVVEHLECIFNTDWSSIKKGNSHTDCNMIEKRWENLQSYTGPYSLYVKINTWFAHVNVNQAYVFASCNYVLQKFCNKLTLCKKSKSY